MTIVNGYCTVPDVQARGGFDTDQTPAIEHAITAASRLIDRHCGRRFWIDAAVSTRVYVARDSCILDVHDIAVTTGVVVKTDDDSSGTYETTWSAGDYQLEPLNGIVDQIEGHAYTRVRALDTRTFPAGGIRPRVQVTAKWGWAAVPATIAAVCVDIAARAASSPVGVRSETIGSYQVVYHRSSSGGESSLFLAEDEAAALVPFTRVGIA